MRPLESLPTWILSSAASRSHRILQSCLADAGVTGYEYRCLTALAANDHLSQTRLGTAAALDPRDVTHTVRALEERGLVVRDKDPGHGRRLLVSLTDSGSRLARDLGPAIDRAQTEAFQQLTTDELSTLLTLLEKVG